MQELQERFFIKMPVFRPSDGNYLIFRIRFYNYFFLKTGTVLHGSPNIMLDASGRSRLVTST